MQIGRVAFNNNNINIDTHLYCEWFDKSISLEDLAEMFGLNTDVSDLPPVADISTLHRRNATAITRRHKLCN